MSLQKLTYLLLTCALLTSCASVQPTNTTHQSATAADIGVRYLLGRGVPKDDAKAFHYFKQAADENDDAFAQNELGYLYATGKGTTQNYKQAFAYYEKAAKLNLASAQYSLGLLYARGLGTEANPALAKEWFKKSAAHGFEPARQMLNEP